MWDEGVRSVRETVLDAVTRFFNNKLAKYQQQPQQRAKGSKTRDNDDDERRDGGGRQETLFEHKRELTSMDYVITAHVMGIPFGYRLGLVSLESFR